MTDPIIIPCKTEEDWHAARAKGIGASEAAALIGEHPYLTPRRLWEQKNGQPDDEQETERMQAGHYAELMNAPWYSKKTGRKVLTPQEFYGCLGHYAVILRHPTLPLQATLDRVIVAERANPGSLQLKNVGEWMSDAWPEGEEPPLWVLVQVQVELMCSGFSWGAIGAVIGGNRRRDADVAKHEAFQAKLATLAAAFWASLKTGEKPAPMAEDFERVKRAHPLSTPGLSCEYPNPEDIYELARLKAEEKANEEARGALMAKIGSIAGPAELLTHGGKKLATWKTQTRNDPPREARTSTFRVFSVDRSILKEARATLPSHEQPILPA